ncbi:alpha/beta hydrolase [Mycetocola sp. 2940]|uniref:alpha/beta fold hydrolase n=1 Tax=Mycetocola sp. 2940 TaxID=3156452 RepID=UPI0033952FEE
MLSLPSAMGRMAMPWAIRYKRRSLSRLHQNPPDSRTVRSFERSGIDATRMSPELLSALGDSVEGFSDRRRAGAAVTSFVSVLSAMMVDQRHAVAAVDRVRVPTLLIWGARERHIQRGLVDDLIARRPDWQLEVLEESGHVPTWDAPGAYVDAVARWARSA